MYPPNVTLQVWLFLESLLQDAGLNFTDPQAKQTVINDLNIKLEGFLAVVIEENLSDEDLVEYFQLLLSETNGGQLEQFLQTKIPNLDVVLANAMLEFRQVYLSSIT